MGSWANSLHVRQSDPSAVVEAIRGLVIAKGYEADVGQYKPAAAHKAEDQGPTVLPGPFPKQDDDELPRSLNVEDWDDEDWARDEQRFEEDLDQMDDDDGDDEGSDEDGASDDFDPRGPRERRLIVYQPVAGWVGILDNAGLMEDFGKELSNKLKTETMLVYVNDSDSWGYDLHSKGWPIGRYDSSGDSEGEVDDAQMSPELQAAIARGDEAEIERLMEKEFFLKNSPQGPIVFHDGRMAMPPAMAILKARMQEGRATLVDRLRYFWMWIKFQARRLLGWLLPSTLQFGFDVPHSKPLDAETVSGQIRTLHDLFPNADVNALQALLPQSRFPSEDLLKQFLEIIGLPALYAYLSYDYRSDFGRRELATNGIVQVAELRFVLPPRPGRTP